jgi:murein DD-endopeptidase MepM/ murein hydrolase activator NlpD
MDQQTGTSARRHQLDAERTRRAVSVPPTATSPVRAVRHQPARTTSRKPGRRRPILSGITILFVAAVTLVTTIPVNSLLSPADVARAQAPTWTASDVEPQELGAVSGGADVPIARDGYSVTESLKEQLKVTAAGRAAEFTNNSSAAIQWPFAIGVPMSDQFGPRVLCDTCEVTMHRGVDFLPGRGAPIQAIADGVVRYVEESDDGLGVHAIVDHQINGQLVSSVYCHMEFGSVAVAVGEPVHVGQLIGTVGDTGFAFGPHLHFEIRLNGSENVDPVAWLTANAG